MEIRVDNKIFFSVLAVVGVVIVAAAVSMLGGKFVDRLSQASKAEIDSGMRECLDWIPTEYESVEYNTRGEFKRQQDDELIYTIWGSDSDYATTMTGITCVHNYKTGTTKKPSVFDQTYR